jgi:hypothetical protein
MEIVSSACAEVCKNVSEDLRDLRNNFLAGVNDLDTQARSVVVQQCRDFAVTVRVFGIGVSHATTSRTLLQFPPHASDTVILRIAKEMYDAHPDWQSNQQLSLEESSGKNSRNFHTQKGMKSTHKGMKNHCFSRKIPFHT